MKVFDYFATLKTVSLEVKETEFFLRNSIVNNLVPLKFVQNIVVLKFK